MCPRGRSRGCTERDSGAAAGVSDDRWTDRMNLMPPIGGHPTHPPSSAVLRSLQRFVVHHVLWRGTRNDAERRSRPRIYGLSGDVCAISGYSPRPSPVPPLPRAGQQPPTSRRHAAQRDDPDGCTVIT